MGSIRTRPSAQCPLCGQGGQPLWRGVRDQLFGVPGEWSFDRCMNASCGLVWQNPMPVAEDLPYAYASYYTHYEETAPSGRLRSLYRKARKSYLAHRYGYASRLTPATRLLGYGCYLHPLLRADADFNAYYLPALAGGRLLEVGCGGGRMLAEMAERGWSVEGVDFDERALAVARKRGVTVRSGGVSQQHYPNASFDAIVLSHVIEHLPDPVRELQECYRILKPNGVVVMFTPNTDSLGLKWYGPAWRGLEPPRHLYLFNPATAKALVDRAGFAGARIFTTVRIASYMFLASRSLRARGAFPMGGRASLRERCVSWFLQLYESLWMVVRPNVGEELVVIARK